MNISENSIDKSDFVFLYAAIDQSFFFSIFSIDTADRKNGKTLWYTQRNVFWYKFFLFIHFIYTCMRRKKHRVNKLNTIFYAPKVVNR